MDPRQQRPVVEQQPAWGQQEPGRPTAPGPMPSYGMPPSGQAPQPLPQPVQQPSPTGPSPQQQASSGEAALKQAAGRAKEIMASQPNPYQQAKAFERLKAEYLNTYRQQSIKLSEN